MEKAISITYFRVCVCVCVSERAWVSACVCVLACVWVLVQGRRCVLSHVQPYLSSMQRASAILSTSFSMGSDRRIDGRADMTKVTIGFCNVVNAPKNNYMLK